MNFRNVVITTILIFSISSSANAQIPNYVPTDSLSGWWPYSGIALDESGNENHAVVFNAYPAEDRFGEELSSYFFDGTLSYLELPNSPSLSRVDTDFTISFWVKLNAYNPSFNANVISNRSGSSVSGVGSMLAINGQQNSNGVGRISFVSCCGNFFQSSSVIPLQTWKHIVLTYIQSSSTISIFIDGQLDATGNISDWDENISFTHSIGREPNTIPVSPGNSYSLYGFLDDFGIWKRQLNSQEVFSLYNSCEEIITEQPIDLDAPLTSNAQFNVVVTDSIAALQWQTDIGFGFQNLSNAGQYSGVSTSNLLISNVSISNDGQQFRCVVTSTCSDISDVATLHIQNPTSINDKDGFNGISLYPNPSAAILNIDHGLEQNSWLEIRDVAGKLVRQEQMFSKPHRTNVADLPKGVYLVIITNNTDVVVSRFIKF